MLDLPFLLRTEQTEKRYPGQDNLADEAEQLQGEEEPCAWPCDFATGWVKEGRAYVWRLVSSW